jgi:hypothetical protein
MTEQPQPEQPKSEEDLTNEFRVLGETLVEAIRTAWERPERKRLQQEIENGLNELGTTLRQESEAFKESPTGQRLKSEFSDLHGKIRSGEAESRLRLELIGALRAINTELRKATDRWSGASDQPEQTESPAAEPPEQEV